MHYTALHRTAPCHATPLYHSTPCQSPLQTLDFIPLHSRSIQSSPVHTLHRTTEHGTAQHHTAELTTPHRRAQHLAAQHNTVHITAKHMRRAHHTPGTDSQSRLGMLCLSQVACPLAESSTISLCCFHNLVKSESDPMTGSPFLMRSHRFGTVILRVTHLSVGCEPPFGPSKPALKLRM